MPKDSLSRQFLRHERMLKDYIRAAVRDFNDAEDLFQETGVQILDHSNPPTDPARFGAWARGLARNLMLHYWREVRNDRERPIEEYLDVLETAFREADPEIEKWNQRRLKLDRCLDELPEKSRTLLRRRYREGAGSSEMAHEIGRTVAAVRIMLTRIRQSLSACIERRMRDTGPV